jgi:hypothetical protein
MFLALLGAPGVTSDTVLRFMHEYMKKKVSVAILPDLTRFAIDRQHFQVVERLQEHISGALSNPQIPGM